MQQSILHFPEIELSARDGHKMRGYFAHLFGEDSDLWHNHQPDGKVIYRYPLIQYKVVKHAPMIIGLKEGAQLLIQRFLNIQQLEIDGQIIAVHQKNLQGRVANPGVGDSLYDYTFLTPWMALNQKNYKQYNELPETARKNYLEKILQNNILAFFKGIDHFENNRIIVKLRQLKSVSIQFKNEPMFGFLGTFTTNTTLPDYIGLGKSVARGFGTILKEP